MGRCVCREHHPPHSLLRARLCLPVLSNNANAVVSCVYCIQVPIVKSIEYVAWFVWIKRRTRILVGTMAPGALPRFIDDHCRTALINEFYRRARLFALKLKPVEQRSLAHWCIMTICIQRAPLPIIVERETRLLLKARYSTLSCWFRWLKSLSWRRLVCCCSESVA